MNFLNVFPGHKLQVIDYLKNFMYNLFCPYSVLLPLVSSHSYPNKLATGGL